MRESIPEIETKLRDLGVPTSIIEQHCQRLDKYRKSHPKKIRRHRWWDGWSDEVEVAPTQGKRRYVGATAVFNKRGN